MQPELALVPGPGGLTSSLALRSGFRNDVRGCTEAVKRLGLKGDRMAELKLRMAFDSALLNAFQEGTAPVEGVDLEIERIAPRERHHRMAHNLEWDICEYSSASLMTGLAQGLPFTALPVFPLREFRYRNIWTSEAAGLSGPEDLNGKRIGIQNWDNSAALWQKGPLADDYGLDLSSVEWVCLVPPEAQGYATPSWLRMTVLPKGEKLEQHLLTGDIAAMMVPFPPQWPEGQEAQFRRLFADSAKAEQGFFEKHGVFPIMHTVVIKNDVLDANPWVAERVFEATRQSMDQFVEAKRAEGGKSTVWPSMTWTEQEAKLGPQPWPAGVDANRASLETAIRYAHEQGLVPRRYEPEELFQHNGESVI
jgi:4,5-dihydroxyphthalate decarboxylase